jgi:hypothetical protein
MTMKKQGAKIKHKENKKEKQQTVSSMLASIPNNMRIGIIGIIILALVFIAAYYFFHNIYTPGIVRYGGLTFDLKEKVGAIQLYHYAYLYKDKTGELVQNNIYLRTNPAKNNIPLSGNISFLVNRTTYIGIDTDHLTACNDSSIAIAELAGFLKNGGLSIKGGSLNKTFAESINATYVSCSIQNLNLSSVIKIEMKNDTRVTNRGLCYTIEAASCSEVLPAVEKFIVESIIQAKANTPVQNKTV